ERLAGQLHPVADAEDGDVQIEDARVAVRRAGRVDACRPTREDDAARLQLGHALRAQVVPDELAEDVLFPDPARDELAVLGAEVKNQDSFAFGRSCRHSSGPPVNKRKSEAETKRFPAFALFLAAVGLRLLDYIGRHCFPNSIARRVAASTASMSAARSPPRSKAWRPAMVVP